MAQQTINLGSGPDTAGGDSRYDAFVKVNANTTELYAEITAAVPQSVVTTGNTLAVTRAAHQGATIILGGAGATISFSATTQGNGFAFTVRNRTGSAWTIPTFTGGTAFYSEGATHTQLKSGGTAGFEVYTVNSTLTVGIDGATV